MKRLLLLGVCIVLGSAMTARADLFFGTFTNGSGDSVTVNYARTAYSGSIDTIALNVGAISGTSATKLTGLGASGAGGALFTVSTGGAIMTDWTLYKATLVKGVPNYPAAPKSYVAFDGDTPGIDGLYSDNPSYPTDAKTFFDTWYTSTEAVKVSVGGTLAKIYVNKDAGFTLSATVGVADLGVNNGHTVFLSSGGIVPPVPEPGTLALLASGLIGLLAYAWRKRR